MSSLCAAQISSTFCINIMVFILPHVFFQTYLVSCQNIYKASLFFELLIPRETEERSKKKVKRKQINNYLFFFFVHVGFLILRMTVFRRKWRRLNFKSLLCLLFFFEFLLFMFMMFALK